MQVKNFPTEKLDKYIIQKYGKILVNEKIREQVRKHTLEFTAAELRREVDIKSEYGFNHFK